MEAVVEWNASRLHNLLTMALVFKMETEAAARSRRRRTRGYVEESDAATTKVYT